MSDLSITILSKDEIEKLNYLEGILDKNYETDFYKNFKKSRGDLITKTCMLERELVNKK